MINFQKGMSLLNANGEISPSTLGYQYTTQTTTQIRAKVKDQKFYKIKVSDFLPVVVGTGAWMEEIKTNLSYQVAGDFETGVISTASAPSQLSTVDVGTSPVTTYLNTWAKGYQYSDIEVDKALAANNWDVIEAKMKALKENWDLGIQRTAFLGSLSDSRITGLMNNAAVTVDSSTIGENISGMTSAEFAAFVTAVVAAFWSNSNGTSMPNRFVMPMSDYLGLVAPTNADFTIVNKLDYLLNAFKIATGNNDFKISGIAYGDPAHSFGKYVTLRYALYNDSDDVLCMDIPVDFQLRPANTSNNFQWNGVAVGQFAGVTIFRPAEVLYFAHAA